jgi:hypothetical protein
MGYRMCKPYLEAVEKEFGSDSQVGVVRVQFEVNILKWALLKYYISPKVLRLSFTPEQQVVCWLAN